MKMAERKPKESPNFEDCEVKCAKDPKKTTPPSSKKPTVQSSATANDLIRKIAAQLTKGGPPQQLVMGSVSGWTTGYVLMKIGRPTAFLVGGGIIASQIVHHAGYGNMDWNKMKEQAKQATKKLDTKYNQKPEWLASAKRYSRANPYFTAGFVGGFLIGVVS